MCLHNPNGLLVFRKFKNTASAVCLCSLVTTLGGACQKISEKLFQIDSSRGGFLCHFDSFLNLPIVFVRRFLTLTLDYQPFWMGFVVQINWKNLNWLIYKIRTTLLWKSCLCLYFASYFYFLLETRGCCCWEWGDSAASSNWFSGKINQRNLSSLSEVYHVIHATFHSNLIGM